jgi:hypothetical protein
VNYIFGVAAIPKGFQRVDAIDEDKGGIVLRCGDASARVPVDLGFLRGSA